MIIDHQSSSIIIIFQNFSMFFKISNFDRKLSKSMKILSNTLNIDFSSNISKIENSNLDQIITYRSKMIENKLKSMKIPSNISEIDFSSKISKIENSNLDQIITYRSKIIENELKLMKHRSKNDPPKKVSPQPTQ